MDRYVSAKELQKTIDIHNQTLYRMEERGEIDVIRIGTKRMYNIDKLMRDKGINKKKLKICYCRVSSSKQKEDLKRQIDYMNKNYPYHQVISDIGSGLNMKRPGLKKIIDWAINGEIDEIVITYKDRLARFSYDLIEDIIKRYSNGKIVVINDDEEETPNEEIVKDIISIMNVYVAKINGLRRYKNILRNEIEKTNKT